jgi:sugar phosphate isomerase/epimerase
MNEHEHEHEQLDRRTFLARAALAPLGAAVAMSSTGRFAAAQTPIKRVAGARVKTGLNAYTFTKTLNDQLKGRAKGMSLFELIDFCAEQGFDAIDPTGYFFPGYPKVPTAAYINDFKRRAFQNGVDISGTGIRNNFAAPDKAARADDVRHAKEWVEVAAALGAPVLRVFSGPVPDGYTWDQVAAWMADDLRECAEHGKKHGVVIGLQNHGDMLKNADEVLKVLKMVDSPWIGSIVDTGYFLTPDPYVDMARVLPYGVNWQIKEKLGTQPNSARVDMRRIARIVKEGGYRGYLPIETLASKTEKDNYDPRARSTALLKQLREALVEVQLL